MHGIHHVTAIAGKPQRNLDFYTGTLGLRLVKKTVNFDDPGTYHFYYGDETGTPGTILTFFPWDRAAPGRLHPGFALLAIRSRAPVIPLSIDGADRAWPRGRMWPGPAAVRVRVGPPVSAPPGERRNAIDTLLSGVERALGELARPPVGGR